MNSDIIDFPVWWREKTYCNTLTQHGNQSNNMSAFIVKQGVDRKYFYPYISNWKRKGIKV